MANILDEVLSKLPENANITEACFEGANIILYTKNKDFFLNNNGYIKEIVNDIKKRVELRPDPSIAMEIEKAQEIIENIFPKEAGVNNIIFDPQRARVIIEAEKPGLAIGKAGSILKEIRQKTLWVPIIRRTPAIRSKIIESIRHVLYENNDERKKFLNKVGKRIYDGWIREKKSEWVRVSFLGAGREVGRSCLLLQTPESRVLLDCGINVAAQGDDQFPILDVPEFDIKELDAIIISHAHVDHCAFLPYLVKYGYDGPIYCTLPTRDVMALLQLDYIGIQQKDAKKALYSSTEIKKMVKHTICLEYEEVADITPDVRLTFYNAGHSLGSAMCHLHIGNGLHNLLYTADLNYEVSNLLSRAVTKFPRLETVIIEGTYGGKDDVITFRSDSERDLINKINETLKRGGKVLMPVLGVGRSQEIMIVIERAVREGLIEKIPIFIQGMVWDITAIHTAYPDFFNSKIKKLIFHKDQNPFLSDIFKRVGSQKEMQEVIDETGSCVIMATSGMMQGGASVEYFKNLADNHKNTVILTCYQGEGSLGRKLQNGEKEILFQNGSKQDIVRVNCEIVTLRGFSGHNNREQTLEFLRRLIPSPKKVIINHGENSKCLELASTIHKMFRVETISPRNLETVRLR
ncbi:beta-CASP ribonuclease aCPSF1 [Candidatus Woesearchaeota archaeon]|nr:beta-CASP ribonuclease aCPSF1 [Candidatus Woesearchaeota archaeon]